MSSQRMAEEMEAQMRIIKNYQSLLPKAVAEQMNKHD